MNRVLPVDDDAYEGSAFSHRKSSMGGANLVTAALIAIE